MVCGDTDNGEKITEMKNYYAFGQLVDKNPIFALYSY